MMKIYRIGRHNFQYEEGQQPPGAIEVTAEQETGAKTEAKTEAKAVKPKNKARKGTTK